MKIIRQLIIAAAAIIAGSAFTAQAQLTSSPYSKFGYGLLNDNATSAQRAMGGVGYAMRSGRQINVMNPASYAATDSLTFLFDMGVNLETYSYRDADARFNDVGGGLDYITMQFPLSKRLGMSVGLLPFSSVGYAFGSEIENGTSSRQGSGGINMAYVGLGYRPVKGLSVGFNLSYLFGNTFNDVYAISSSGSTSLFEKVMKVRDWRAEFGIQYGYTFGIDHTVTAGVTFSPGKDLRGHTYAVKYDVNSDTKADTVGYTNLKGKFSLPDTWGFGVNYQWADRLMVEADFTLQNWSKAKYTAIEGYDEDIQFANRTKFAFGAQYRHKVRGNYLQRIQWRAGMFTGRDYMMVAGNHVNEFGVSAGFGLPTPGGNKTVINLGFQYIHRQASPNPLVKENYCNITLGVNLNELWFMASKIR